MSTRPGLTIGIDGRFLQDKFHGIGRYTYGLVAGLCAIEGDHRVVLFTDPSLRNTRFPLGGLARNGKVTLRHVTMPLYGLSELWSWPLELRRNAVDVFHSPYFWSPIILPCPLVTTFHDMIFDRYPDYIPGRRFLVPYKFSSRLALRKSRRVIAVSEATRRDILHFARIAEERITTVLSGVDAASRFVASATVADRDRVRDKYRLPTPYILAVGARRPHKNIERLVGAFDLIAGEVPHSLVLVGTVDRRFQDRASEAIRGLTHAGRVREIGHVDDDDMAALYAGAELFVQPSIIEGFGFPVLEAMACGCPVACSNTSSLPEIAGDAAAYFDPWRETEIADALRRVLADARMRCDLRERGLARARRFDWRTTAARTLDVYRSAVAPPPRVRGTPG